MTVPYSISSNGTISVYVGDDLTRQTVLPNDVRYEELKKLLLIEASEQEIEECLNKVVKREEIFVARAQECGYSAEFLDGEVYLNGAVVHSVLASRIKDLVRDGFSPKSALNFYERVMQNPSSSAVNELYDFLANKGLPLTEDGCFLAYKAVRHDFKDIYSGTFDNSPGNVVQIPRNEVDDDRRHECSYGLHVGAQDYVRGYGSGNSKYLVVKVDPKDCVAVPRDHNAQKLRVCRYEVLREVSRDSILEEAVYDESGSEVAENDPFMTGQVDWEYFELLEATDDLANEDLKDLADYLSVETNFTSVDEVGEKVAEILYDLQHEDRDLFQDLVVRYF